MKRRPNISFAGQLELPFEEFRQEHTDRQQYEGPERTTADNPADRLINFISFGSGSSGNSCYIGNRHTGIIVDAGVRAEQIADTLAANGVPMNRVRAVLLTHDHSDHVKYAYTLLRNNRHMKLFCTNRVVTGLLRRHGISKRIRDYHVPIFKEIPFKIGNLEITAFDVPHDGTDNMGFSIKYDNRNFVLATDLGEVTDRARHYMSQASYLVIEANYDLKMLREGRYPEYLKARIQTSHGHLDNNDTAAFLADIANPDLKYVFLCHLSQDNNTPAKALAAVRNALEAKGLVVGGTEETIEDRKSDIRLAALPRFEPTRWFVFRP